MQVTRKAWRLWMVAAGLAWAAVVSHATATPAVDPLRAESLTVEQARELASRKAPLQFNALVAIDAAIAAELAKHEGAICFTALTELSPEAARALTAHVGNLRLPALERLDSPELARKLAGQWGELKVGVTELAPEIAAILATNEGVFEDRSRPGVVLQRADKARSVLWFAALKKLEPAAAESLAAHQGVLVLNELTELSPEAAAALARRKGGSLILNGLERLSPETAEALAAYDGEIALRALRDPSPEAATALAAHRGRLHLMQGVDVRPVARRPSP